MPDERRRHVRKRVDLPCSFDVDGEGVIAHVSDMSPGGAFIDTDATPVLNTPILVHVQLPTGTVDIKATVRWKKPTGIGIQFGMLGAKDTYAITEYLAAHEDLPDSRLFQ